MVDRNRALKLEDLVGGSTSDPCPTETNPNSDGLDARAYFAQNGSTADSTAYLSRTGANLTLTDGAAGTKNAQDLVSRVLGSVAAHQSLLDAIHFLPDGPGDGWASGAYCSDQYTGLLKTSSVWYTDANQTKKIFGVFWTYSGLLVTSKKFVVYAADGVSTVVAVTDSYAYNGSMVTSRTRTWGAS